MRGPERPQTVPRTNLRGAHIRAPGGRENPRLVGCGLLRRAPYLWPDRRPFLLPGFLRGAGKHLPSPNTEPPTAFFQWPRSPRRTGQHPCNVPRRSTSRRCSSRLPVIGEVLGKIADRHTDRDSYLDDARKDLDEARAFVQQKHLL